MRRDDNKVVGRGLKWWIFAAVCGLLIALESTGDAGRELLRYDRIAIIGEGELWRLFTGHLVHLGWQHLALNLVGLLLMWALFFTDYSPLRWLWILAVSMVFIDAGFLFLDRSLQWYVGFSGVLHGALAAGAVAWWRYETKVMASALTAIVIAKLAWEQYQGALPLLGNMPVIVNAHLYGALGGALAALIANRHFGLQAR